MRGRRAQLTSPTPTDASTPSSAAPIVVPRRSTVSPGWMSSPARRTLLPGSTEAETSTRPSRVLVSSTRTTASAPAGTTAPVEIAIACPSSRAERAGRPARDSPATRSATGAPAPAPLVSAARTANPSIEELSKPGTASELAMSAARTRPSAERSGTGSAVGGPTRSNTSRRAFETSINFFGTCNLPRVEPRSSVIGAGGSRARSLHRHCIRNLHMQCSGSHA